MLDNPIRRWFFPTSEILTPFLKSGMSVLDIGCGGGRFAIAAAKIVGEDGCVVALDVQSKMLDYVETLAEKNDVGGIVEAHHAQQSNLNLDSTKKFDFALAMMMVHETLDCVEFFKQVKGHIQRGGLFLVIEPMLHVTKKKFEEEVEAAKSVGFEFVEYKKIGRMCRAFLLQA